MAQQTLEEVIRDLAARGELNHISLAGPTATRKTFSASFAMCSKYGVSFAEDEDPVKAIMIACTTAKMRPAPRVTKPTTTIDLEAERIAETPIAEAEAADPLADLM